MNQFLLVLALGGTVTAQPPADSQTPTREPVSWLQLSTENAPELFIKDGSSVVLDMRAVGRQPEPRPVVWIVEHPSVWDPNIF